MIYSEFIEDWEVFSANFSKAVQTKHAERVYQLVRDLSAKEFHARCLFLMQSAKEFPRNLMQAFAPQRVHDPCSWRTQERHCPLAGCVSDSLSGSHWLCPYHASCRYQHFESEQEERTYFDSWCEDARWPICTADPDTLWRIVNGSLPLSAAGNQLNPTHNA